MKLVRSFFFVLNLKEEKKFFPFKFRLYKWSMVQQTISWTESQAPGIFQIGFH